MKSIVKKNGLLDSETDTETDNKNGDDNLGGFLNEVGRPLLRFLHCTETEYIFKCERFPSAVLVITIIPLYGFTITPNQYSVNLTNLVVLTFGRRPL